MNQNHPGLRVPSILRPAVLLFDGLSGRDRRRARHLKDDLEALRQESLQFEQDRTALQEEVSQLRKRLKGSTLELQQELNQRLAETERLKQSLRELRQEQEQEQRRQAQLQAQIAQKTDQCARLEKEMTTSAAANQQLQTDLLEIEELVQQTWDENMMLGRENQSLHQDHTSQDAYFRVVVEQLEAFEQRLRAKGAEAWQDFRDIWKSLNLHETLFPIAPLETVNTDDVDLSALHLALVGGHDSTRRGVIELLSSHGLKHVVEVEPASQRRISQSRVKAKIQHCDLVVVISGYMSHKMTDILNNLDQNDALAGKRLYPKCRGSTGVAREILLHLQD